MVSKVAISLFLTLVFTLISWGALDLMNIINLDGSEGTFFDKSFIIISFIISIYYGFKIGISSNKSTKEETMETKTSTEIKELPKLQISKEEKELSSLFPKEESIYSKNDSLKIKEESKPITSQGQERMRDMFKSDDDELLTKYPHRQRFFENTVDSSFPFDFKFMYLLKDDNKIDGILIYNLDDKKKSIEYTKDDIERFKLIDKNSTLEQGFVRTAAKGGLGYVLLGPVGLLAGALSTKKKLREKVKFGIEFIDKNWLILEYDLSDFDDEEEIEIFQRTLVNDNESEGVVRPAPF